MSPPAATARLSKDGLSPVLRQRLFAAEEGLNTYAVLDGASIPGLLERLDDEEPEFACLYRGELEPELAEVAPYLVQLEPDSAFTEWLLSKGWGKHWGIFAATGADLAATRRHFRTFLMVKSPDRSQLYFRFYDPRVFRVYLPTCNAEELAIVFGPIGSYALEDEDASVLVKFSSDGQRVQCDKASLTQ